MKLSNLRTRAIFALGLLAAVPAMASAAPKPPQARDYCIVNRSIHTGNALWTLVFQDVEALQPGRSIELRGIFFTPVRIPVPFHGAAIMSSDGTIRMGISVHHSARNEYTPTIYTNDKVFSGMVDSNFAGTLNLDFNGDAIPDGTLPFLSEDCAGHPIP